MPVYNRGIKIWMELWYFSPMPSGHNGKCLLKQVMQLYALWIKTGNTNWGNLQLHCVKAGQVWPISIFKLGISKKKRKKKKLI